MAIQYSYARFLQSEVYQEAILRTDTTCFWFELIECICFAIFYKGWHSAVNYPLKRDIMLYMVYTLGVRAVELRMPALYARWRLVFLRSLRYSAMWATFALLPQGLTMYRNGSLLGRITQDVFVYKKQRAPSIWESFRLTILSSGSILCLTGFERMLPLPDQAMVHFSYLFVLLTWVLQPAAELLAMPAFSPGTLEVCRGINNAAHFNPLFLFISAKAASDLRPDHCSKHAAQRVVLFLDLYLVFLIPVYYIYRREHTLKQRYIQRLRAAANPQARAQPRAGARRWQVPPVVLDLAGAVFMGMVTWRLVVEHDEWLVSVLEWVRVRIEAVWAAGRAQWRASAALAQ